MKNREVVVRIIYPSDKPSLHKKNIAVEPEIIEKRGLLSKALNILTGSSIGLLAGLLIYLMLKFSGLDLGGMESTFIIGLPALLGIATSLAIF